VDIGGGTGSNLEFFGKNLNHWSKVVVLDLCPSLVKTAQKRVDEHGWSSFVDVVQGDACDFKCPGLPPAGSVDVVTFSYALSMIPDWNKALQNAFRLLKPGGHIAVCDFTTSEKQWMGMSDFWVWLFAHDHVHLKGAHIAVSYS
jgi:S-adenosylmethionine-diacylgycerolhomoserine-N-methlytransferase